MLVCGDLPDLISISSNSILGFSPIAVVECGTFGGYPGPICVDPPLESWGVSSSVGI